ncbi:uncharacterized protein K489DRAFT_391360 [Dissoconium aciculare CBS 342.82]|uniref:MADS-box domain-containing protein n=1 Tax=Dissoconium aciculare CBS 342.82 TaxID=1314786 RepID=A0A6J3LS33_9PEZI|nr:uncharacterized protein K489DRAFT_391360 [Dissoconium aciculare CBS 342.82]KAF1818094.1 hypothetical protein K489DRAFT_391360 [Dissoconium aciculare CBS 342.82]
MGRRKIEIKPIRDDRNRSVTFLKRKGGLFKKAHELSVLCSVDVAVIIFGNNKKLYEYSSSDINEIINRFQYYGGAHEHKGPSDFTDKGGGDDDDDDDGGDDMGDEHGTPVPMMQPQMQHHPGFQNQAFLEDSRRTSMPPGYPPQQVPQANMGRSSQEHLQPPPPSLQHPNIPRHLSPQPQHQQRRPTASPQPPQHQFASPPIPQPRPLPASKAPVIFTPIDDSRSMLAQHWGSTSTAGSTRADASAKVEESGPRPSSIDVGTLQRSSQHPGKPPRSRSRSPRPAEPPTSAAPTGPPHRSSTSGSMDAKRPRLTVQIPSEASPVDGNATGASVLEDSSAAQTAPTSDPSAHNHSQHLQQPQLLHHNHHGVHLPPPSPSAGNPLLSAGAQGPPNPFARPAPPMSTNPHAMNRDAAAPGQSNSNHNNNIDTPLTALPSRFMSDNLLPSPSSFYPEWNLGRLTSAAGDMSAGGLGVLPSPLNFGVGTRRDDDGPSLEASSSKKRPASGPAEEDGSGSGSADESGGGSGATGSESDAKRVKT